MASTYSTNRHLRTIEIGNGKQILTISKKETKLYNGIRAADLSELFSPLNTKQQTKRNIAKLTQSVLLCGHHNRIYHYSSSKNYYHSIELPLDWLIFYDSLSRVSRDPTEIYGYKLFSVPYLILPDKTKSESHYHNSTEHFDTDWLISSKRKRITVVIHHTQPTQVLVEVY